jgi:hypothetical protein
MKVNRVYKIYRPMRRFGNLLKDIFCPETSTHWWIRLPEGTETQREKIELLKKVQELIVKRIKVYESNQR